MYVSSSDMLSKFAFKKVAVKSVNLTLNTKNEYKTPFWGKQLGR